MTPNERRKRVLSIAAALLAAASGFTTLAGTQSGTPSPPAATPAPTAKLLGDWHGTLDVGGAKLRLAFHLGRKADGTLEATLDSLDQGASGIPVATATFSGSKLHLDLSGMGASYDGTLGADGTTIAGTWTQGGGSLPLSLTKGAAQHVTPPAEEPSPSDPIRPLWRGTLDAGGTPLHLIVHLTAAADASLTASLDSPDQGAMGIAIDRASFKNRRLTLELRQLGARFAGTMNAEGSELTGVWSQGGVDLPLTLKPGDSER